MTFDVPSKTKGPHYRERQPRQQNQLCWATCLLSGTGAERSESFKSSLFGTRDEPLILHMDFAMCIVYTYVWKHQEYVTTKGGYQYEG